MRHTTGFLGIASEDLQCRDRDNKFAAPGSHLGHLFHDLILQVPGQDENIIRADFGNFFRRQNWNVGTGQEVGLLVDVTVDREADELCADTAIIK